MALEWQVVFEQIWFDFFVCTQPARNDLDLQNSHTFIHSIRCLLLPTFRSLAAIVSEKSTVFTFSHVTAQITKLDLAVKYVKVTPGSSFELHTKFRGNRPAGSGEEEF